MCIFCEIIENKIPSKKIFEDNDFISILDISQATKGHTLVIPKKHVETINDLSDEMLSKMICLTKKLANQITNNLQAKGYNLLVNTNEIAGQTIKHAHMHILPRYDTNDNIQISFKENKYDLDEIMKEIKIS